MINWEVLIIPLIALAVWILGSIFRGAEEQKEKERPRPPREQGGRPRSPRRPVTDLDRFLEEARARRQTVPKREPEEQERPSRPEPVVLEALPVEKPPTVKPRERPQPEPRPRTPEPPPRRTTASSPVARPVSPAPVAQPGTMAPIAQTMLPQPPAAPDTRTPTQSPGRPAPVVTVPPTKPRPQSAAAMKLMEILNDRQSLATAFLLREVFDRPMCQRQQRRRTE